MRVTRSASGAGFKPSFSKRARMNWSIGVRTQSRFLTSGRDGRTGALKAQWVWSESAAGSAEGARRKQKIKIKLIRSNRMAHSTTAMKVEASCGIAKRLLDRGHDGAIQNTAGSAGV